MVILAIVIVVWALYPYLVERPLNASRAERYIPVVQAALGQDARFTEVRFGFFSKVGDSGSLMVLGQVDSEDDLKELKKIVESTSPPIVVKYKVEVGVRQQVNSPPR